MKRFLAIILLWALSLSFAKAYSLGANVQSFSANLHKDKAILRDTVDQKEQKFKRWEFGIYGGVNFQKFNSVTDMNLVNASLPLTEHFNTGIQYLFFNEFGMYVGLGYDKFSYSDEYKYMFNSVSYIDKYERTFIVYNLEFDFVYKIKLSRKLSLNSYMGFKTNKFQKDISYYNYFTGSSYQERFHTRKPDYKFNFHTAVGVQLSYALFNRIKLSSNLNYYRQMIDFEDYLDVPLGGYKDWQSVFSINHLSCSLGMSYQF